MYESDYSGSMASEQKGPSRSPNGKLVMLGLIVACSSMVLGMTFGFVTAAIPQIKGSISVVSWFASICGFVAPIGSLGVGVIIDKFGRRAALLWGIVPSIFGWFCIWLSEENTMLLIGRALCGLTYGALLYPQQVYAAECVLVNHQRLLDSFKIWTGVAGAMGALFCLAASLFLNYRELAGVACVITFVEFLLVFQLLPESPVWLILQRRYGDAEWSQKQLGIHTSILCDERVSIGVTPASQTLGHKFAWSTIKSDFYKIKRSDVYKPLTATVLLFALLLASGPIPITSYMINIIGNRPTVEKSVRTAVDPDNVKTSESLQFSIISGVFTLLAHIILCFILPYLSIRKISIPCIFVMALGLGILGYSTVVENADLYMVHVISVWIIVFTYNFGMYNLPGALLGYVFPIDAKGFASVGSAAYVFLGALSLKLYPYLEDIFDGYLYYGYATFALLAGIFAIFFMPETVGKSQYEISEGFTRGI